MGPTTLRDQSAKRRPRTSQAQRDVRKARNRRKKQARKLRKEAIAQKSSNRVLKSVQQSIITIPKLLMLLEHTLFVRHKLRRPKTIDKLCKNELLEHDFNLSNLVFPELVAPKNWFSELEFPDQDFMWETPDAEPHLELNYSNYIIEEPRQYLQKPVSRRPLQHQLGKGSKLSDMPLVKPSPTNEMVLTQRHSSVNTSRLPPSKRYENFDARNPRYLAEYRMMVDEAASDIEREQIHAFALTEADDAWRFGVGCSIFSPLGPQPSTSPSFRTSQSHRGW